MANTMRIALNLIVGILGGAATPLLGVDGVSGPERPRATEVVLFDATQTADGLEAAIAAAHVGIVARIEPLALAGSWSVRIWTELSPEALLDEIALLELGFPSLVEDLDVPGGRGAVRRSLLVGNAKGYDDVEIAAALGNFGTNPVANHAGSAGTWLLETFAATGHELASVMAVLELLPEVQWVQTRPVSVIAQQWPREWFTWYQGSPLVHEVADDSFAIVNSPLSPAEIVAALDDLGLGSFPAVGSFGSLHLVCRPLGEGRSRLGLRRIFRAVQAAGLGIPTPTFLYGLHRGVLGEHFYVRFKSTVPERRRLQLGEAIGTIELATVFGMHAGNAHGRTGVDLMAGVNALDRLAEVDFAAPSMVTVGPGPSDDPTSPQITPCDPSTFP